MKKRIGNDITFTWHIYRKSGETQTPESFDGKEVEVKLISPLKQPVTIEDVTIATGVVTFTFRGKHQVTLGNYVAVLQENRGEDGMVTIDVVSAVTLVPHSYMEEDGDEGDVIEAESVELTSTISAGGGSSFDPSEYVRKVSETAQTIEGDLNIRGEFQSGAYHRYSEDLTIGTFLLQEGIWIDRHHTSDSGIDRRQTISMLGPQGNSLQIKVENWQDIDSVLSLISEIVMSQDVTLRLRNADGTYTEHCLSHKQNVIDDLQTIREGAAAGASAVQPEALASLVNTGTYNSVSKKIELKHDNTTLAEIDATAFIKDGMVNSVVIADGYLVITFNTDAGKEPISISLTDIFNPANYYTKSQVDTALAGKASTDVATTSANGLMSKEDKSNLDYIVNDYTELIQQPYDDVTLYNSMNISTATLSDIKNGTIVMHLDLYNNRMQIRDVVITNIHDGITTEIFRRHFTSFEFIDETVTLSVEEGSIVITNYLENVLLHVTNIVNICPSKRSIASIQDDVDSNTAAITAIEQKIPVQASSSNQLADKAFVNSSIATATATYRGAYNLVSDLSLTTAATQQQIAMALATKMSALSITPDNNDYCFVQIPTADATPTEIARVDRYKYNGTAWSFEFSLNNSGFTAAQWTALNSGITSGLVAKLSALPSNSELTALLTGKANTEDLAEVATNVATKQDKMPIVQVASGTTSINAAVNTYYEVAGEVGTLAITLPTPTDLSKVSMVVVHLTAGTTPNVVIGSTETIDYSAAYDISASKEYEINCLFNGDKWVVADMEVV